MKSEKRIYRGVIDIEDAFNKDGYEVKRTVNRFNRTGIVAEHKTAFNYDTGKKKKAYYLEGSSYEMGYLLGLLAEDEISSMTNDFITNMVPEFIGVNDSHRGKLIENLIISVVYELSKETYLNLPDEVQDEIKGIYEGCKEKNPKTKVTKKRLFILNAGIDIVCSIVYTGIFFPKRVTGLKPSDFKVPILCNAFAIFGEAAGGGHYFGRDFMFPTANVFQDTAAHIIYNPDSKGKKKALPFVSLTAPGMVGSISAMNVNGVGVGVDMSPAANCNPSRVGTNSILLTRIAVEFGGSAGEAVNIMRNTQRGVAWNYIIADGTNDRACIVEAGDSNNNRDFLEFPPDSLRTLLPDMRFINARKSGEFQEGLMVRWNDYKYPVDYLEYNKGLFDYYNKKHSSEKSMYDDAFAEKGYINRDYREKNCPSTHYFAPQREESENIVITTNHFIIPEMRFYAMYPWTAFVVGDKINDIQWRYDELNNQILSALDEKGCIDYKTAKQLVDFLAPYMKHPQYYAENPKSKDGKQTRIEGCVSLFDLKNKTVESHYGYYCDEWVKITLPFYF